MNESQFSCEVLAQTMYTCTGCSRVYSSYDGAEQCAKRGLQQTDVRPGDVVRNIGHSYGWYEGDPLSNPWVEVRPQDGQANGGAAMDALTTTTASGLSLQLRFETIGLGSMQSPSEAPKRNAECSTHGRALVGTSGGGSSRTHPRQS